MIIKQISNRFFYGKYAKCIYICEQKKVSIIDYLLKLLLIYGVVFIALTLIFPNKIYCSIMSIFITIFMVNKIILNSKKIDYQYYILSQLTIYVSQVSMAINYNNVYTSLKETIRFLSYPLKQDLEKVIMNIENGLTISESFKEFNQIYNNKTLTLFNQSLELFDLYGSSDANDVLQIISEEMNDLKIKKDQFLRFKKEWRLNFYVVMFMCLSMPVILKFTMASVYESFMQGFGTITMMIIFIVNLLIISKVEKLYSDLSIGEEGYR